MAVIIGAAKRRQDLETSSRLQFSSDAHRVALVRRRLRSRLRSCGLPSLPECSRGNLLFLPRLQARVAPLKILTIPRLELQGAVLAARLGVMLESELKVQVERRVHWSDSEVVLKYLRNDTKRFRPFIANRVSEIKDLTERESWHHVPTDQNPADLCTRGLQVSSFQEDNAQQDSFAEELDCLKREQPVGQKSRLAHAGPFYDGNSCCLRVGGRLRKASIPDEAKFQMILPTRHPVTHSLTKDTHRRLTHCGQEHVIADLRQKYWPVRAREAAKRAIKDCLLCERKKAKPCIPRMADLPASRLQVTSGPFAYCGVDYWGPMLVKERRSTVKRWGCLFTCLSTRACFPPGTAMLCLDSTYCKIVQERWVSFKTRLL
ncbi:uncharacterized protein LOC135494028 [Lineus longissimus]|uniref:uncharacterized protein LOC135494028 n=1 Tax=Lineus longissimus TaxID=88925 RepID=UPI00315D1103